MALSARPTLRDRLRDRYAIPRPPVPFDLPPVGEILQSKLGDIQLLATRANAGDCASRDLLFLSLQPRLLRIGSAALRPWPNTPVAIGLWDYDDVAQEGYLIFAELLDAWDGEQPFIPYLLARYVWRLRDRILRGIGRPCVPRGMTEMYEPNALEYVVAGEQPESAAIAREVLLRLVAELANSLELQGEHQGHLQLLADSRFPRRGVRLKPGLDKAA